MFLRSLNCFRGKWKLTNVKLLSIHFHILRIITKKLKTESLRVPRTARSNQSILKEINPKYSLEGLMLKLNTHTHSPMEYYSVIKKNEFEI